MKIQKLVKSISDPSNADLDRRILQDVFEIMDENKRTCVGDSKRHPWSRITRSLVRRPVMSAAAVVMVILGVSLYNPFSTEPGLGNGSWWLEPPAAWGQDIMVELEKIAGLSCRERTVILSPDGPQHESSTWNMLYVSEDSYRRDIYDGDQLREVQWVIPGKEGKTIHTSVRHDTKSYFTSEGEGSFGVRDPAERMRFYVGLLEKADRIMGKENIAGYECVGFEINASKYGNNPSEWFDRVWFDVETKLPVRIEKHGHHFTGRPDLKYITIMDQFDYNPDLAADTFVPWRPEDYINAHPDDIRADEGKSE